MSHFYLLNIKDGFSGNLYIYVFIYLFYFRKCTKMHIWSFIMLYHHTFKLWFKGKRKLTLLISSDNCALFAF